MTKKASEPLEMTVAELEGFLNRVRETLSSDDYAIVESLVTTVRDLSLHLDDKKISVARLKALLFGASTEKTRDVLAGKGAPPGEKKKKDKKKRKGHGKNGAADYTGAERVAVTHPSLAAGQQCPACQKGKIYALGEPGRTVRVIGQPFLAATVYETERLRCGLCGDVYTAPLPEEAQGPRYDPTAGSMLAVLKYGSGLPFHRIEKHQQDLGVPVPASVAWEIVEKVAEQVSPVYEELVEQAAQGEVLHNDDTNMKVLEHASAIREEGEAEESGEKKRTGTFTTAIVSQVAEHQIALFFTGRQHAGENLNELLRKRHPDLRAPIQMCDALSRNEPTEFDTLLANCLAHGRRKFVEVASAFPAEVRVVLDWVREVYKNDAVSKKRRDTPEERLHFHQAESGPVMGKLKAWLDEQFAEKKVEPNSSLGRAIAYLCNHWQPLTLFLRVAGAPIDNNVCERVLKMAILHRKNSLFYKTAHGAAVGDALMGLIYTCRLNGINPFDYLTTLLSNVDTIRPTPSEWLPWNYKATLARGQPS